MSREAVAGGPPQDPVREMFSHHERALFREVGYEYGELFEDDHDPNDRLNSFLGAASAHPEPILGAGLARKSFDAALALAGEMDADDTDAMTSSHLTHTYIRIAQTAYDRQDQDPDFVRGVLDTGIARVTDEERPFTPASRMLQLKALAEAAYMTTQGPDYTMAIMDEVRELNAVTHEGPHRTLGSGLRIRQLDNMLGLSQHLALGTEYARDIIDEELARWPENFPESTGQLDNEIRRLAGIARLAHDYGQEPAYVHAIIHEGRQLANWGAGAEAFAGLASAARDVGVRESYAADIVVEGARHTQRWEKSLPLRDTLNSLNALLGATAAFDPDSRFRESLQGQLTSRGINLIEETGGTTSQRHRLLNTLLRGFELDGPVVESRGLERRPLSYVFAPTSPAVEKA